MSNSRPTLVLIDGHALAYQQFFALPVDKFTTQSGEPTNATFGFARTILDILATKPAYLAVSFDQGMTNRDVLYPEYKGTREKMNSDLVIQMDRIRELVQAFNIPILELEGTEADDVIGTIAHQAEAAGIEVRILTGDRDMLQLVTEHVRADLPARKKDQVGIQAYDTARVIAEFGIRPDQFADYKGLVGDTSDNIPGVRGIGEKTAAALLQQYETLDGIYENIEMLKPAVKTKLTEGRDSAYLSKTLATIKRDLPITLDLARCIAHDYKRDPVAALFRTLEFRQLVGRLPEPGESPHSLVVADSDAELEALYAPIDRSPHAAVVDQQMSMFKAPPVVVATVDGPVRLAINTIVVDTPTALQALISALAAAPAVAFDTETTGTDPIRATIVGISLAIDEDSGYYIPVGHRAPGEADPSAMPRQLPLEQVIAALIPALTDPRKEKWAHHAAYDLIMLRRAGVDLAPVSFDTMIAEWLLNPDSRNKGLKNLAWIRLNVEMTHIDELIGRGKKQTTMDLVPIELAAPYAAADAIMTFRLVKVMRAELEKAGLWLLFKDLEIPLIPVLASMDMAGVRLDLPYLDQLSVEFDQRLNDMEHQIHELAGQEFNLGSPKQLNDILFGKLGLPSQGLSRTTHGFTVDADALETLKDKHPIVQLLLDWRSLDKLRSTYVDALKGNVDAEERVHTTYNQTGAVTGRLSSENPNLQNIPIRTEEGRRVRRAFIAIPGCHLLSVDYSQIELRILAHYSGDPFMVNAFEAGQDIHTATAAAVYGIPYADVTKEQRYLAKRVNFGLMYGMGAYRLSRETGLSMSEATQFIKTYFARLPLIEKYLESSKALATQQGYLETLFGRRRRFEALTLTGTDRISTVARARAEREAINMPVQGTNADIIKKAMIQLPERLREAGYEARLILQVHDELVLEVPDPEVVGVAALVQQVMAHAATLDVPLATEAKVGLNWSDMVPVAEWVAPNP